MSANGAAAGGGGEPGDEAAGVVDCTALADRVPQEERQPPAAQLQESFAPPHPLERYLERGAPQRSRGIEVNPLYYNQSLPAVITISETAHVYYLFVVVLCNESSPRARKSCHCFVTCCCT